MTSDLRRTAATRVARGVLVLVCGLLGGCSLKQDMAKQPKDRPLWPDDFFADGRSARPLVQNTVPRGAVQLDALFVPKDSNTFPLPIDMKLLERGQNRFNIYCSPCHGLQGDGDGLVAVRGMKHPPTYHQDRLRQVPNGYIYDVITNGFGIMLDYSAQIAPRDRWAIVAYVRALQLSRNAKMAELPPEVREKILHPPAAQQAGAPEAPGGNKE